MKLVEYWKGKDSSKIVVRHWYGKREYFLGYNMVWWRNSKGRKVFEYKNNALDGLLWVAQQKEKLQLHRIAFDQLTQDNESS